MAWQAFLTNGIAQNPASHTYLVCEHLHTTITRVPQVSAPLLLDANADANVTASGDAMPLLIASKYSHHETVKLLLDAKANANAADSNGFTSLYLASQNGHHETIKLLLDADADVNTAACNSFTPLMISLNSCCAIGISMDGEDIMMTPAGLG